MYNKNFLIIFCMIFLMTITFVSAVPPVTTAFIGNEGLDIQANILHNYKINEGAELHIYVFNISNGAIMTHPDTECRVELTNDSGSVILIGNTVPHETHFKMVRNSSIITEAGVYGIIIVCNSSTVSGSKIQFFRATESGTEIDEARSCLIIGLIAILVFLLFISLYAMFNVKSYIGKFALYWVSHVLIILICFVGWQIGVESILDGIGLTGIFRIMFWIFIVAVLPMVILSGAWIMYIHTFNEHFQKLVDKGMDTESAFRMAKRKSGGWFNGR